MTDNEKQGATVERIIARDMEPQGEPSGIPFYDQKMRELDAIRAQGEPSAAQLKAALDAYFECDFYAHEPSMRRALRAARSVR